MARSSDAVAPLLTPHMETLGNLPVLRNTELTRLRITAGRPAAGRQSEFGAPHFWMSALQRSVWQPKFWDFADGADSGQISAIESLAP